MVTGATEEHLDVLDSNGAFTGIVKTRKAVHMDGDYHRAIHTWIYAESTGELLLQKRAARKDTYPSCWDISSAGHISAGEASLATAIRELQEELGLSLPPVAFEYLQEMFVDSIHNDGAYINKEFCDVYLITLPEPIPTESYTLQASEVEAVKYIKVEDYAEVLRRKDPEYVPYDPDHENMELFRHLRSRYSVDLKAREESLRAQAARYIPVPISSDLSGLSPGDLAALKHVIAAAQVVDQIFLRQVSEANGPLKQHLAEVAASANASELDRLKAGYFRINKTPWSILEEGKPFLTTADSAVLSHKDAMRGPAGPEAAKFRAAFSHKRPLGASYYPLDMDKKEFEAWKGKLTEEAAQSATGFFTVIRRPAGLEAASGGRAPNDRDLQIIPYSVEYKDLLTEAAEQLGMGAKAADTPSLRKLLQSKAAAFLSNDYYESDVAWMELDSAVDVTIGPYETYMDELLGLKASFEAFVGIRDADGTAKVKLFGDHLQELEDNLPLADEHKSKSIRPAPIRVIELVYNSGDVGGPQTMAFNLPNDDRIVKERGTAMVILRNIMQAKFHNILEPIADACISPAQRMHVRFDAFFTHTLCHECCHGIGPHSIIMPDGRESTVRKELQDVHSALEEAKADIVGLWALRYFIDHSLLPAHFSPALYISFLAGCFRTLRFGLREAHGRGQALQFHFLLERGAVVQESDGTFSVDVQKIPGAVEALSREILAIQAVGDRSRAQALLETYARVTPALEHVLNKLKTVQVPTDIAPQFLSIEL